MARSHLLRCAVIGSFVVVALYAAVTVHRRRQFSRHVVTVGCITKLALAISNYARLHHRLPTLIGVGNDLRPYLVPTFWEAQWFPIIDAWGNDIHVTMSSRGYDLWSGGSDGQRDLTVIRRTTAATADIVLSNGRYLQYPEGVTDLAPFQEAALMFPPWEYALEPTPLPDPRATVIHVPAAPGYKPCAAWP